MKLKENLVCNQVAGQTILVDLAQDESDDKMVSTNATGAYIIELLRKPVSEEEIVAALTDKFEVDLPTAQTHVGLFLDGLRKLGFLEE